jgi:bacteriorhodopsin
MAAPLLLISFCFVAAVPVRGKTVGERNLDTIKDHYAHLSSDLDLMWWFHKYLAPDATFEFCPLSASFMDPRYYPNCVAARGKEEYLNYVRSNLYSKLVHFSQSTMTNWSYAVSEDGREVHARYNVSGLLENCRMPPRVDQLMAWKFNDEGLITDTALLTDTLFFHSFSRMALEGKCREAEMRAGVDGAAIAPVSLADHGLYSPLEESVTWSIYVTYYNCLSVGFAGFASTVIFIWLQLPAVGKKYRTALIVALLVNFVAACEYAVAFASWSDAVVARNQGEGNYVVQVTHRPFMFNWLYSDLMGMPLSVVALLLVMDLEPGFLLSKAVALSVATIAMVLFALYGDVHSVSLFIGVVCFVYILYELVIGLENATAKQPPRAKNAVRVVRWFMVVTWTAYPCVAVLPMIGTGSAVDMKVAYTALDLLMKAVMACMIWGVAVLKSDKDGSLLG